ncbi:HERV-H LTR-associating protein 1 [Paramormyrops kingsleyae]|uniref:HERV-H LTR-associating protein 1 n=1 Tax=Paramormyrops kingsleyae TaxID=1676925 RepID=UPI003B97A53D
MDFVLASCSISVPSHQSSFTPVCPESGGPSQAMQALRLKQTPTGVIITLLSHSAFPALAPLSCFPGSQHIFTLLSITSHSSLAFNKLTVLVYNISNFRNVETSLFPMRYCYCLTNRSNDLTDFTAILLDIMGNSSSYLHEIFKSSSILSVSQNKDPDCIYICVMAGKTERDLSQLWEVESVKPLFNQTITADIHRGNFSPSAPVLLHCGEHSSSVRAEQRHDVISPSKEWHHSLSGSSTDSSAQPSGTQNGPANATAPARGDVTPSRSPTSRTVSPASFAERPRRVAGCPWKKTDISQAGTVRKNVEPTASTAATPISAQKLQSCLLELCKFFSRCRCRDSDRGGAARYCAENQRWYARYTTEVCKRVKRVSYSKNLKQRCLARMCAKP